MTDLRQSQGYGAPVPTRYRLLPWFSVLLAMVSLAASAWLCLHVRQLDDIELAGRQGVQQQLNSLHQQIQAAADERLGLQRQLTEQKTGLENVRNSLTEAQRRQWLVQEVAFYLNLAEQHLQLQRDVEPAQRLLAMADSVLGSERDSQLIPLRSALAADRLALVAAGQIDKAGLSLRLDALKQSSTRLVWPMQSGVPQASHIEASLPAHEGIREKGWRAFRELITIRHYDKPVRPLLSDDQRWLLQQNVYLELTQAQQALWANQQERYRQSLKNAEQLIGDFGRPYTTGDGFTREIHDLEAFSLPPVPLTLEQSRKAVSALLQLQPATAEPVRPGAP